MKRGRSQCPARTLAFMYDNGHGVPQDYVQAQQWYNLAASQGIEEARK